ncbi:MAG: glycosyltransferase family 2 protein [Armatimonadetes bacterium]|nr:glycosyltransferase family 2 protein [Armatimonadota bacterium]
MMRMRPATVRHLVLASLAAGWIALVAASITYRDALWFRYYVVDLVWLQYLFLVLAIFGGAVLLLGVATRRPSPGRWPVAPMVSIIIPAKNEVCVIEGSVRSACAQSYDGEIEVIVVDDHSTDGTLELLEGLQTELPVKVVQTVPGSIGKAAALQVGIAQSRGALLAVFDSDARLGPDVVAQMVPHLADPGTGAVQGRRLVHNPGRNWLTRVQADEYRVFQTLLQRARQAVGAFVCLAGNGLIVKREALEDVGGWNEEALTEDIDLSVRLALRGWEIRYCYEAQVWEEGVVALRDLIRQRERWFEGALLCLGDYLPQILFGRVPLLRRVDMLFFLSGALLSALAVLTGYIYAMIGLAYEAVVYLQLPRAVMAAASGLLTVGMLAAITAEVGFSPWRLAGVLVRWTLFSFHTMVIVPLAIRRYIYGALTGARDWRKTSHEGARSQPYDSRA